MLYARNNFRLPNGELNPSYNELAPNYNSVSREFQGIQAGSGREVTFAPKLDWDNQVTLIHVGRVRNRILVAKGDVSRQDFTKIMIRQARGEVVEGVARTFELDSRKAVEYAWRLIGEKYNLPAADPETGEAYIESNQ